jgi:hypothetical protein
MRRAVHSRDEAAASDARDGKETFLHRVTIVARLHLIAV